MTITIRPWLLACLALLGCVLAGALSTRPAEAATFGEAFGLAGSQGAVPGAGAFWAGTCDLGSSATEYETAAPPATPRDCIDTGTTNFDPRSAEAWSPAPAWRLSAVTGAGAHPDATALFAFARDTANLSGMANTVPAPAGSTRDIQVDLPPGVTGDPGAVPKCSNAQFQTLPPTCPPASQVGIAEIRVNLTAAAIGDYTLPVYALEPLPGRTAEFGIPRVTFTAIRIVAKDRTAGDFGISTGVERIPTGLPLVQQSLTFWGVPWAASHDLWRPRVGAKAMGEEFLGPPVGEFSRESGIPAAGLKPDDQAPYEPSWGPIQPFFTNPTACTGSSPVTTFWADSWQNPAATLADGEPDPSNPLWVRGESAAPPVTGCAALAAHFDPGFTFRPQGHVADSPSAFDADLSVPQNDEPPAGVAEDPSESGAPAYWRSEAGLATSQLKDTTVTLPPGVTVNPAGASGLATCSEEQMGLLTTSGEAPSPIRFDDQPVTCPDASKIGTVEIETPLLEKTVEGTVYLAQQEANPFGSLLALYLVAEDPERGLIIKLAGKTTPDPVTGQITATFTDNPQLPFTHLRLHLKGGPAAPLATPPTCGSFTTQASLVPWSGQTPATTSDGFTIDQAPEAGCPTSVGAQPFNLGLEAGTANPVAGASSPFTFRVTRPDGAQTIDHIDLTTPPGFSAYLAGVPYCPESGIAQAEGRNRPGDGRLEEAQPSCPAASQVGTTTIGAGAGPNPYYVSGKVYLAGPYKGAPLSLVFVVPAVAGPFDLGVQVVRTALQVNPETAAITAQSDAIPTILQGIPLRIRDIRVSIDRPHFALNPTSCDALAVGGQVYGSGGGVANLSNRFQVGGCPALPFHPKLKLRLTGSTTRTGHPALKAVVTAKPGEANISRVQVNLPHGEFLDQGNLNKTCTKPVLLAGDCPASTVYGHVRAWTPLLERPLEGYVYLVGGYGYKLPALVAELNGQVKILLVGKVDSGKNKGIRNTFEVVPDAPVSRFELAMKGGKKYGLLENSEDLCKASKPNRAAIVRMIAHNNKRADQFPLVGRQCKKKKGGGAKNRHKGS
jgi:hypothetical protein